MPAKRAYGMDQDFYPWSPIVARPVLRWPEGARVALAVIVNLEHWDWEVPAGTLAAVSPMGRPEGMCTGNQPQFPHRQFPHIPTGSYALTGHKGASKRSHFATRRVRLRRDPRH